MIVLDASALIDAFAGNEDVRRRIAAEDVHAPHLLDVEVANALRRLVAQHRVEERDARSILDAVGLANIVRHPHVDLLGPIWAMRASIGCYDAAYVALAAALRAPLVTTDQKLASAPGLPCVVEAV